jgi:hypothetical protein
MTRKLIAFFMVLLCSSIALASSVDCREKGALLILYKVKAIVSSQMDRERIPRSSPLACELLKKEEFPHLIKIRDEGIERCKKGLEESRFISKIKSDTSLEEAISIIHTDSAEGDCVGSFMITEMAKNARRIKGLNDVDEICRVFSSFKSKLYKRRMHCEQTSAQKHN